MESRVRLKDTTFEILSFLNDNQEHVPPECEVHAITYKQSLDLFSKGCASLCKRPLTVEQKESRKKRKEAEFLETMWIVADTTSPGDVGDEEETEKEAQAESTLNDHDLLQTEKATDTELEEMYASHQNWLTDPDLNMLTT